MHLKLCYAKTPPTATCTSYDLCCLQANQNIEKLLFLQNDLRSKL